MNVIAYRVPDSERIIWQVEKDSCGFTDGKEGFLISAFSDSGCPHFYRPMNSLTSIPKNTIEENFRDFSFKILDFQAYSDYIAFIKKTLDGDMGSKIVASRREPTMVEVSVDRLFSTLCEEYPDALVFYISTSDFGTWIGASPEVLLEREGDTLSAMSLAGTRPAGTSGEWDRKNLFEQQIVTDFIVSVFEHNGIPSHTLPRRTLKTGRIEHILTLVEGVLPSSLPSYNKLERVYNLLTDLSPTPALSGFPRQTAMEVIEQFEGNRALYGGFCGPVTSCGDFRLNVILRCACLISDSRAILFAGGGVTALSEANEEWKETERKINNLRCFFADGDS